MLGLRQMTTIHHEPYPARRMNGTTAAALGVGTDGAIEERALEIPFEISIHFRRGNRQFIKHTLDERR